MVLLILKIAPCDHERLNLLSAGLNEHNLRQSKVHVRTHYFGMGVFILSRTRWVSKTGKTEECVHRGDEKILFETHS